MKLHISLFLSVVAQQSVAFTTKPLRPNSVFNVNNRLHSSVTANEEDLRNSVDSLSPVQEVSAVDNVQKKSYLDDGFIFGLEDSGLERPKGKIATIVVEGDSLETQPYQVGLVSATFLAQFAFTVHAISDMIALNNGNVPLSVAQAVATILSSWVLADFGSGVLHWSVDNYGNGRTPIMGNIIAAFQGHHSAPWTITNRGFCNNVYKLCIPFGIPTVAVINLLAGSSHPTVSLFFTIFCAMEILSQEFHKWSHMTKGECGPLINSLQNLGLTIDKKSHALHHTAPYEGQYCIISGICNDALDNSGIFRRLEHIIYNINGVESNAWKLDPELKAKTLRGEYGLN